MIAHDDWADAVFELDVLIFKSFEFGAAEFFKGGVFGDAAGFEGLGCQFSCDDEGLLPHFGGTVFEVGVE